MWLNAKEFVKSRDDERNVCLCLGKRMITECLQSGELKLVPGFVSAFNYPKQLKLWKQASFRDQLLFQLCAGQFKVLPCVVRSTDVSFLPKERQKPPQRVKGNGSFSLQE